MSIKARRASQAKRFSVSRIHVLQMLPFVTRLPDIDGFEKNRVFDRGYHRVLLNVGAKESDVAPNA